jgi:hypothetical protein
MHKPPHHCLTLFNHPYDNKRDIQTLRALSHAATYLPVSPALFSFNK